MTRRGPDALRARASGGTFCVVPYCHPDFAWTHHREWHEERYAVSICEALDLMRAHPEFRFCIEPWLDQVEPFLDRCPDRAEELSERLNSGQMGVLAFTMASPRPATCPDETFIRNMVLGRKAYRDLAPAARLNVMACPDVGIGHSQMPQLVKLAGARMYRGWRSDAAFTALGVPRDFVWRGLDGTGIITSRGIYGGLCWRDQLPEDLTADWEETVRRLCETELELAMENSFTHTWWVAAGQDDGRPLRAYAGDHPMPVLELVREWNAREQSRMVFATPSEYLERLEQENLPLWSGPIDQVDVAYNSGWHGARGLWRLRQELDTALVIAERACALAEVHGAREVAPAEPLGTLWTESVRASSHALQWVFTRDWEWLLPRVRHAVNAAREATALAVQALSGIGRASTEPRPLVLYNPLPYARQELVEVPWAQPRQDAGGHTVLDANGRPMELQLGEPEGVEWSEQVVERPLIFMATVPAMGYATYRVGAGPNPPPLQAPADGSVSNGRLAVRIGPRGLERVRDDATGIEWAATPGSRIADCKLFTMGPGPLHVGPITGTLSAEGGSGRWVLAGPLRWMYRWESEFDGHRLRQDISMDRGLPYLDLRTRVMCSGANGFFALCFDLPVSGEMHADIPFGVEPRDVTKEVYGDDLPPGPGNIERHRRGQFWARSWVSVSDGKRGVTFITADGDRYWIQDPESGELRHILFTALEDEAPHWDQWERWITKDRLALGWHEFRHRLLFHGGGWREAGVCAESDRLRLPLQAVKPVGPSRQASAPASDLLTIEPTTVRVSAVYMQAGRLVVRLYESAGVESEATVTLPRRVSSAERTDFNLEPIGEPLRLDSGRIHVPLGPWQIATVVASMT